MAINEVVRSLKVGESARIDSSVVGVNQGIVKRVAINSFSLHIEGSLRHRWGNSDEISRDIDNFISTGALPPFRGQSWA
jgi:hypothetical protein